MRSRVRQTTTELRRKACLRASASALAAPTFEREVQGSTNDILLRMQGVECGRLDSSTVEVEGEGRTGCEFSSSRARADARRPARSAIRSYGRCHSITLDAACMSELTSVATSTRLGSWSTDAVDEVTLDLHSQSRDKVHLTCKTACQRAILPAE